ncbi:MAG: fimbrillin family protein [Bacteroidales bacterium]|nr:fimbrillin family protein [Bacteroidales bacterium]
MKKTTILLACSAIACTAILAGCSKGVFGNGGQEIRFTTSSSGSSATKTAYGADQNGKQALDWEENDAITIASLQAVVQDGVNAGAHSSNYVVNEVTSTGINSKARVRNEGTNGLVWTDGEDSFDFYAVYPKVGTEKTNLTLTPSGDVTATIPNLQPLNGNASDKTVEGADITYKEYKPDMKFAYMTAATTRVAPSTKNNAVSLTFDPAFTAFEFNVSSADEEEIVLTMFELLSPVPDAAEGETPSAPDVIAGNFSMKAGSDISAEDAVTVTGGTNSIKVDMSDDPQTVDDKTGLTFTVFALPVANTAALRLRFTSQEGTDGSKTSWLDMKYGKNATEHTPGAPVIFEAGHKYRINMLKLPSSQWKISIVPIFEDWVAAEEEVVIYI